HDGTPLRPTELRVDVVELYSSLEWAVQCADCHRFSAATHIASRVLETCPRSCESLLIGHECRRYAELGQTGDGNPSVRHSSATTGHLEADPVHDIVSLGFMNFDDDVFLILR